ncbi:hypothetical protein V6N13_054826 [Hibiscus sabdariffa]
MEEARIQEIFTVFVENIPKAMEWKGLWYTFARHGDVVGTYIARKLSRRGRKFGFMRVKKKIDAERVIERLNGFNLFGFKLLVKMARFEGKEGGRDTIKGAGPRDKGKISPGCRSVEGEQAGIGEQLKHHNPWNKLNAIGKEEGRMPREPYERKKVIGHVEEKELWNLRRSLVGKSTTVCSVNSIQSRLSAWGLGEIKEIFLTVELWTENIHSKISRATWLEISGVPLSCWNQITLSRVAELWGSFEALGENANHTLNCESVLVLITTSLDSKISEVVEIEVGNLTFMVRVEEKGFSDQTTQIPIGLGNHSKKMSEKIDDKYVSSSESTSESSLRASPAFEASSQGEEEDAFKVVLVGKDVLDCNDVGNCTRSFLGEAELMGRGLQVPKNSGVKKDEVIEEGVDQVVGLRWAAVIKEMLGTTHELYGLVGATTKAATYPFHSEDLEAEPKQPVGSRLREASNVNKVLISGPEGVAIWSATSCPIHSEDLDVVSPKQPVGSKVGEGSDTNNIKIAEIMDRPRVLEQFSRLRHDYSLLGSWWIFVGLLEFCSLDRDLQLVCQPHSRTCVSIYFCY